MEALTSVPGVCEVEHFEPAQPRGWLLIEVPHGATREAEYLAVARRLASALPAQLEHFFFVNTDVGAPEGASWLGRALSALGFGVLVVRCLIPRTFIDTNRVLGSTVQGVVVDGLTPAVPGYVTDAADGAWLCEQHAAYHAVVARAYEHICGERNGLALQLHTFSPRSVGIERTDAGIVQALHAAYEPKVYATWPERPAVDCIAATADGSFRSAPALVVALRAEYAMAGIFAEENATYALHPATMGLFYARAWPDRVLCVELNRGLLASPFVPFGVSPIDPVKVERLVAPLARTLAVALERAN
jgi:hypothetical protein